MNEKGEFVITGKNVRVVPYDKYEQELRMRVEDADKVRDTLPDYISLFN